MTRLTWLVSRKVQILVIAVLTISVYINILPNHLVIDDHTFIEGWKTIRDIRNIPKLIHGDLPETQGGVYRPVRSLLYVVYYQLWRTNPVGYHVHAVFVHVITTVFIYLILEQLPFFTSPKKEQYLAFVTSLLFGLHPIHTESITYIAAAMEMTGMAFMFASLYFYVSRQKRRRLFMAVFAFLAFFTYEMTLVLPVLMLLITAVFPSDEPLLRRMRKLGIDLVIVIVIALLFGFIRVFVLHITSRGDYLGYSFYYTMLMMPKVFIQYIWLLVWPFGISYIHDLAPGFESFMTKYSHIDAIRSQSIFDWQVLGAIAILVVLIVLAVKLRKKFPVVTFGVAWFFISLLPVSYILPQGIALAEKYLYSASLGFILILGYFLIFIYKKNTKVLVILVFISITVIYGALTVRRNADWLNEIVFWQKVIQQHPKSSLAYYMLGVHLFETHRFDEAMHAYNQAVTIEPKYVEAYYNMGGIYKIKGDLANAKRMYNLVLLTDPSFKLAQDRLDTLNDPIPVEYESKNGIGFSYPNTWKVNENGADVVVQSSGRMHINIRQLPYDGSTPFPVFVDAQSTHGALVKEGTGQVKGREQVMVRFWSDQGKQGIELFMLDTSVVFDVYGVPFDSANTKDFDGIITTLHRIEK